MLSALGVLFDGLAYGSLLFLISIGLSVTMGLMNFINLAHGAFAMAGGYVCVVHDYRYERRSVAQRTTHNAQQHNSNKGNKGNNTKTRKHATPHMQHAAPNTRATQV